MRKAYIATVQIVIHPDAEVTCEAEAADWFSGLLSENDQILDWGYLEKNGEYTSPREIDVDVENYEEGDVFNSPKPQMTKEEKFALLMHSLFNDAINGHTGLLRSIAERTQGFTYKTVDAKMQKIDEPVSSFCLSTANDLQKKLKRALSEIAEFVGGEERMRELKRKDLFGEEQDAAIPDAPKQEVQETSEGTKRPLRSSHSVPVL